MGDPLDILRKLSGATKAFAIVNEYASGNMALPEIRSLLALLAASDLERVGLLELVRQQAEDSGLSKESSDLLLGGLSGAPGHFPTPGTGIPINDLKEPPSRKTLTIKPFQRPDAAAPGGRKPPPPPPLYPGQGQRVPRRTSFVPKAPSTEEPTVPQGFDAPVKAKTFFGGAGTPGFARMAEEAKRRVKILVADDDPRIRMVFRLKLQSAGYTVIEASDGADAWKKFETDSPALIVLDMKMPGLHGLELLARLTSLGSQVPVCICTAYDQLRDEFVVKNYGAVRYFVKPVNADELLAAVRELTPLAES